MKTSPHIESVSWGQIRVTGQSAAYKDAKLYPGGSREWDWRETGTHHDPGVQPADLEELLEHGASVVVLSRGFQERLQVSEDALAYLAEADVPVHILAQRWSATTSFAKMSLWAP